LSYVLVAALISTCSSPPPLLRQVLDLGELRVVTRNTPTTYYEGPEGPEGPEYDLVSGFAETLGVDLVLISVDSVSEIMPMLLSGEAHLGAAGLSATESRREYLDFSYPYQKVDMHLIYKLGTGRPRSMDDTAGRSIEVVADSSHSQMMEALSQVYPDLNWSQNADDEVIDLLEKVALGEIDFTISDSTEFNIQRHFYPDLRVALDLEVDDPIAWAFRREDGASLLEAADRYLIESDRSGMLAQITDRYYGHTEEFDYVGTRSFIRHFESRLPRYRSTFEQAGEAAAVDWRLLAAIGYQESHWRSHAVSPTGVKGIMMLTTATADYLDIEDRMDPESSILGGARYFALQLDRLPDSIVEPDRTWFALAAYNVGYNHLMDARQIVEWQGGDPDKWVDVSEALPLLAKRRWYERVPYGYARGWEPVLYVNNIRSYHNIILWLTENEAPLEAEDESEQLPAADDEADIEIASTA
jgi:membrane-bound lytic murein transglycosylase F